MGNELSDHPEVENTQNNVHRYANTFPGLEGQAIGLPKKLEKPEEDLQTLQVLQSSPDVISTSIHLTKARSMNALIE